MILAKAYGWREGRGLIECGTRWIGLVTPVDSLKRVLGENEQLSHLAVSQELDVVVKSISLASVKKSV